jgi:hypothetical protein
MFWSDVPLWISVFVMVATVFAALGMAAAIHVAVRRSDGSLGRPAPLSVGAAALLGGWLLVSVVLAGAGVFRANPGSSLPPIILGVFLPVVIGCAAFLLSPTLRRLADAVPPHWAIAAQAPRVFGFIFLALFAQDRLPAVFAYRAGYGDILVGAAAPLVAYWYLSRKPGARRAAIGFNLVGLADLALAIGTGVLAAPSAFRQIFTSPSTELMTVLPMVLVPVFLVPLFTLIHIFSLRQLLHEARSPEEMVPSRLGRGSSAPAPIRAGR